jgi:hypothetical protein
MFYACCCRHASGAQHAGVGGVPAPEGVMYGRHDLDFQDKLICYVLLAVDMRAERNILSLEVFPRLKEYCGRHDLDFQVVDMRWGITDESQNDHSAEKICLQEIDNCQQTSLGPNFVVS